MQGTSTTTPPHAMPLPTPPSDAPAPSRRHPGSSRRLRGWHAAAALLLILPAPAAPGGEASPRPELQAPINELFYDYALPEPGRYALPPLMKAADGEVLQTDGNPERLLALMKGRITVLSFIYTRCPNPTACPMATGALRELQRFSQEDPSVADEMLLLSLSFDPAHDTPRQMEAFGKANRLDADGAPWKFLTAPTQEALRPILDGYGQVLDRRKGDGRIYHPVRVYLIDREGQVRNIYSFGMLDPRMVMTDIRTLLLEETRGQGTRYTR